MSHFKFRLLLTSLIHLKPAGLEPSQEVKTFTDHLFHVSRRRLGSRLSETLLTVGDLGPELVVHPDDLGSLRRGHAVAEGCAARGSEALIKKVSTLVSIQQ